MAPDVQNARAINAMRLLKEAKDITIEKMITIGYNHYLSAFDILLPSLFKAYNGLPNTDTRKKRLAEPITLFTNYGISILQLHP